MIRMSLGAYVFPDNPSQVSALMTPIKHAAAVKTYTSVAYFSWGSSVVGKVIDLYWGYMTIAQYDQLATLLTADAALVFDPKDGKNKTFNVELMDLTGTYFIKLGEGHRHDVTLRLLILAEVA